MLPIRGKNKPAEVKAPRSKGCRVCVQRRIKCDQTKPHCLRCQRANRECPGFETTKFVDEGPTLKAFYQGSDSKDASGSSRSSSASPHAGQGNEPSTGSSKAQPRKARTRSITPIDAENWEPGAFEQTAMINIICPTAYQNQLLADFIDSVRQPVRAPTFRCHSIWLRDIAMCSNQSSCLTWAVRAISLAHFGRVTRDPNFIETSRRVYGKALLKLNDALQDPAEGLSSNTLSATMILSFYEVFNCTDRTSWIKHAGGAGHLIRLRGPARHRTGTDRTIFIACRYSLIMESFQNRSPCFLNSPEWRALGWEIHNEIKRESPATAFLDSHEQFFQEIVTHPEYLRNAIDAVADPTPNPAYLQTLLATGQNHRLNYQAIHARLTDELRAQGSEPTRTASKFNDTTFPVVYEYRDINIASLYVGYWACLCAINITLIGLQGKLTKGGQQQAFDSRSTSTDLPSQGFQQMPSSSTSRPAHNPYQGALLPRGRPVWDAATSYSTSFSNQTHLFIAENANYAREICKSVEQMQSAPFIGPLFLVLSLRMALRMGITRREKEWVLEKLDTIGQNMGIAKSEVEVYWSQRSEAEAVRKVRMREGPGQGETGGSEKGVGSGVEMPGVGVVGFGDDEDVNQGGLDPVGPPVVDVAMQKNWNQGVVDPAILSSGDDGTATTATVGADASLVGDLGWGDPVDPGYTTGSKGLVSEMNPVGTVTQGQGFGTLGGLGVEWEESAGMWRQGSGEGGAGGVSGAKL